MSTNQFTHQNNPLIDPQQQQQQQQHQHHHEHQHEHGLENRGAGLGGTVDDGTYNGQQNITGAYGNQQGTTGIGQQSSRTVPPPGEPMKDRNVLAQLINPDGHKVREGAFPQGEGASSALDGYTVPQGHKLHTNENAPKEHNVLRQILNPHGHKVDDVAFGANATARRQ